MECDVWHTSLTKPNCPNILRANALRGNIASSIFHCSTQTNCPHSALKHFWPTWLGIEEVRRALLAQAGWCWWWSRTHSSLTFSTPWVFLSTLHNRTSAHHYSVTVTISIKPVYTFTHILTSQQKLHVSTRVTSGHSCWYIWSVCCDVRMWVNVYTGFMLIGGCRRRRRRSSVVDYRALDVSSEKYFRIFSICKNYLNSLVSLM